MPAQYIIANMNAYSGNKTENMATIMTIIMTIEDNISQNRLIAFGY